MATKTMFKGKETYKEELAEGKALKSGKITPQQYASGEKSEKAMKGMKSAQAPAKGKMPAFLMKKK